MNPKSLQEPQPSAKNPSPSPQPFKEPQRLQCLRRHSLFRNSHHRCSFGDSGKFITWGSTDDLGQSYVTSGKHGETPEPFPLLPEVSIVKAAAGWAHCVSVTGLGNLGSKYHGTRHNVGFEVINSISKAQGIRMNTIQSMALIGIGSIGDVPILLAKAQTYMNFSGESAGPLATYYQVSLRHILLVYDEMSLPNGVLRLQPKGGHGYHNGLKNVMGYLDGSREFPWLSIGIGNPPGNMDVKAFLLQKFSLVERKQIDTSLEQGVEAVRTLVLNGFNNHVYRFNLGQKYKYH
ncbi:Chloroplastic group IIB intron splicing facilitator CRS2-B [Arachis hypogaea]|nr:Chloroplastic group IIB intron splicing facilitator CRS2-B [Arachis hypogaea]